MTWGCHSGNAPSSGAETNPKPAAPDTTYAREDADAPVGTAAAVTVDSKDARPVLVCFGDSLTAGLGTGPGQSYPDYLQGDLDKLHFHYRVVNEGISGNTTKDGVERLPEILALHPAVAVVEFGGNDGLRGIAHRGHAGKSG